MTSIFSWPGLLYFPGISLSVLPLLPTGSWNNQFLDMISWKTLPWVSGPTWQLSMCHNGCKTKGHPDYATLTSQDSSQTFSQSSYLGPSVVLSTQETHLDSFTFLFSLPKVDDLVKGGLFLTTAWSHFLTWDTEGKQSIFSESHWQSHSSPVLTWKNTRMPLSVGWLGIADDNSVGLNFGPKYYTDLGNNSSYICLVPEL